MRIGFCYQAGRISHEPTARLGALNTSTYSLDVPHLILGGTTKAASTSLFKYLGDHPDVCKAAIKESRFFIDSDYPVSPVVPFSDGLAGYSRLFSNYRSGQVCIEATPDYLYSPGTPKRIFDTLPNVKLVFVLRDPVARLVSWFRFAKQVNQLAAGEEFTDYVEMQLNAEGAAAPQHMRALSQGRYSCFIDAYRAVFGDARIKVVWFEHLRAGPRELMSCLCDFAGIDASFYEHYTFEVENKTVELRSPALHAGLVRAGRMARRVIYRFPRALVVLRKMKRSVQPIYRSLNRAGLAPIDIPEPTLQRLNEYYRGDRQALVRLTGSEPPWPDYSRSGNG